MTQTILVPGCTVPRKSHITSKLDPTFQISFVLFSCVFVVIVVVVFVLRGGGPQFVRLCGKRLERSRAGDTAHESISLFILVWVTHFFYISDVC